jgi:hypothetical protein
VHSPLEIRVKQIPDEVTPINPAAAPSFSVNWIQDVKKLRRSRDFPLTGRKIPQFYLSLGLKSAFYRGTLIAQEDSYGGFFRRSIQERDSNVRQT